MLFPFLINTIMKIREIITEDVDMSWWQDKDAEFNPEALKQIRKQEKRSEMFKDNGTQVFTKPVRSPENNFSNIPPEDAAPSAGYVGNVEVRTRAKHISPEYAEKLASMPLPRPPQLPR